MDETAQNGPKRLASTIFEPSEPLNGTKLQIPLWSCRAGRREPVAVDFATEAASAAALLPALIKFEDWGL
jgi:hypothetical protein